MTTEYLKEIFGLKRIFQILVKEKYTQLCLALLFGHINTIGYTQTLPPSLKKTVHKKLITKN